MTSRVRPSRRRPGAAAALLCAVAATASGVVLATPGQASTGIFLYSDGTTGLLVPMLSPPDEKCFDVFHAKDAKNFTGSDAILFSDGLCSEVVVKLIPGESLNVGFNSFGFTPPGATGDGPRTWEHGVRPGS